MEVMTLRTEDKQKIRYKLCFIFKTVLRYSETYSQKEISVAISVSLPEVTT